ncbi:MAG TPA: class I SAM-dependent methyltransferase [Geminicoccaceae bacterium]
MRAFTVKRGFLRSSTDGYCPRCNAKARHRRDWLYLRDRTDLLKGPVKLLEVGPRWAFARRFQTMPGVEYVGLDLVRRGPEVTTLGDVTALPMPDASFDAVLCIHVLEHVADDRGAISEIHRVLRPGGFAIITVPIRLDRPTHEDPSITAPEERARAFGERGHVRSYGKDFADRLRVAGFEVRLDPASGVSSAVRRRFGLRGDENIFHCRKAQPGPGSSGAAP